MSQSCLHSLNKLLKPNHILQVWGLIEITQFHQIGVIQAVNWIKCLTIHIRENNPASRRNSTMQVSGIVLKTTFYSIFYNENYCICFKLYCSLLLYSSVCNTPALFQGLACCRTGDNDNPVHRSTHCFPGPRWVNTCVCHAKVCFKAITFSCWNIFMPRLPLLVGVWWVALNRLSMSIRAPYWLRRLFYQDLPHQTVRVSEDVQCETIFPWCRISRGFF